MSFFKKLFMKNSSDKNDPVHTLHNELKKNDEFLRAVSIPTLSLHSNVFPKYKNIHKNDNIAVIGTGPSLDMYKPISNVINIGVNRAFLYDKIKFDYLFAQDYHSDVQNNMDEYTGNNCHKFYGIHYIKGVRCIPEISCQRAGAERYYFEDLPLSRNILPFPLDISSAPFGTYSSVIFPAIQFALWTHPKTIYLVGCDCSNHGYFKNGKKSDNTQIIYFERILHGWKKMALFIENFYPDIEIVSINPVGLKGIFNDMYR